MNLKQLQSEHNEWAERNFGAHEAWQPLVGMIEELGELAEARREGNVPKILDAIGDVMIFMCDFCSCVSFDFDELVAGKRTKIFNDDLRIWAGKLCHHFLKKHQGIRGKADEHTQDIRIILHYIIGILDNQCVLLGTSVERVTVDTWQTVKVRDWT